MGPHRILYGGIKKKCWHLKSWSGGCFFYSHFALYTNTHYYYYLYLIYSIFSPFYYNNFFSFFPICFFSEILYVLHLKRTTRRYKQHKL